VTLEKIFLNSRVFAKIRSLMLQREKDRAFRESVIRVLKRILKRSVKSIEFIKEKKIHVLISFIIEREFKSLPVQRERL
jgi:hypothetical protein